MNKGFKNIKIENANSVMDDNLLDAIGDFIQQYITDNHGVTVGGFSFSVALEVDYTEDADGVE